MTDDLTENLMQWWRTVINKDDKKRTTSNEKSGELIRMSVIFRKSQDLSGGGTRKPRKQNPSKTSKWFSVLIFLYFNMRFVWHVCLPGVPSKQAFSFLTRKSAIFFIFSLFFLFRFSLRPPLYEDNWITGSGLLCQPTTVQQWPG